MATYLKMPASRWWGGLPWKCLRCSFEETGRPARWSVRSRSAETILWSDWPSGWTRSSRREVGTGLHCMMKAFFLFWGSNLNQVQLSLQPARVLNEWAIIFLPILYLQSEGCSEIISFLIDMNGQRLSDRIRVVDFYLYDTRVCVQH